MSFDVNRVCRVCLEEVTSPAYTSLFTGDFGLTPSMMLMQCVKVQVQHDDGLPPQMCDNCMYRLGVAYHFKQQCENSDMRLRQYLGIEFKQPSSNKDASTNTEKPVVRTEKVPVKKRIRKKTHKRKPESEKLSRGPKPRPKQQQTCYHCGKTFRCAAQLEIHIRTHTGERPFACDYCQRRFAQKYNLSVHLRTHTGEKPFQCEICSKQFTALGNFQAHQKIHTGIRDQICPVCNKSYLTAGDLSRHMATHTGIKNHHCEVCGKGFCRNRDVISHKSKVHHIGKPMPSRTVPETITNPIDRAPQDISINRRPATPIMLPSSSIRRPMQEYESDNMTAHPPILINHVQMNY